jgi:hypothetical protein
MTHIIKHLEGAVKRTHPKPETPRKEEIPARGGGRGDRSGQICAGKKGFRRRTEEIDGGEPTGGLGHGRRSGEVTGKNRTWPRETPGRGLYAPAAGSPDAHYVAPDAFGDHRTKTQRVS